MEHTMITDFLTHLEAQRRSPNTIATYRRSLAKMSFDLTKVSPQELQQWVDDASLAGASPNSIRTATAAISSYYRWANAAGVRTDDPSRNLVCPRLPDTLPKALDSQDIRNILQDAAIKACDFITCRDWAILELGYAVAARESDLTQAKLVDLDMERLELRVIGKGQVEACLPFGLHAEKALLKYLKWRSNIPGEYLFCQTSGARMTSLYDVVHKVAKVGSHVFFRHSAATHMLDRGASLTEVSEILRHKSINTTKRYTRMTGNKIRAAYEMYHPRT